MIRSTFLLFLLLSIPVTLLADVKFREDFRENEAHIPIANDDLTSPFLSLQRIGKSADKLKLSHHPEIKNDPHYLWNGLTKSPVLIAFKFKKHLDLSAPNWTCRLRTKNVGESRLHLAVEVQGQWYMQKDAISNHPDWNIQSISLSDSSWRTLSSKTAVPGKSIKAPDLRKVTAMGFAAPIKSNKSKSCIRLDWFELAQVTTPPTTGFLESNAPFLRSALLIKDNNRVRRGLLIPLGQNHWACFDPDLLRWAAYWQAPTDKPPLTYDSMAAVSYPRKKAKAKSAPSLLGIIISQSPELPGFGPQEDPRATLFDKPDTKVGPLPPSQARWLGHHLSGSQVILNYRLGETLISETVSHDSKQSFTRTLKVGPHSRPLSLQVSPIFQHLHGENAQLSEGRLILQPSSSTRIISLGSQPITPAPFPELIPANPIDHKPLLAKNPSHKSQGAFTTRSIAFPDGDRFIRPTDIAFLSDGTGLLSTLDGDIWKISNIETSTSSWSRIATGIFEPISLETTPDDRIFVLGRDQVTELIDQNGDTIIDHYRNASDAFLQTLQTRDYATSLAIEKNGDFLIAKGGIYSSKKKRTIETELSTHRGTITRLSADGTTSQVLADGLRLPYVGLREDGSIFASDQQGHYVPSTPLHLIKKKPTFLGHTPTNYQKRKTADEPLLWYPYQANRSGAAFATTSAQALPDLQNTFLQISWDGRLFAVATPKHGQAFSWRLPIQLDFPSLNGATHPKSGRLYLTGIGISGYKPTTPNLRGLSSIEQTSPLPTPTSLEIKENTIVAHFNRPLSPNETLLPDNPALRLFNIQRSSKYGSGHFKWDQEPGEHRLQPITCVTSEDRQTLILTFDHLFASDVLDLSLKATSGTNTLPLHLYTRPSHLPKANKQALQQLAQQDKSNILKPGNPNRGKAHFSTYACSGCHAFDTTPLVGPSFKGLNKRLTLPLIKQSILEPNAVIAEGYPASMPSFAGVIPPQELADLLAYLATLN